MEVGGRHEVTRLCVILRQAFTNLLRVEEGGEAFVTEEHLQVRDRDTREEELEVELQRIPRHGRLEFRGQTLRQGAGFRLLDLRGLGLRSDTTRKDGCRLGLVTAVDACPVTGTSTMTPRPPRTRCT